MQTGTMIYPMGATILEGGVHFSVEAKGKSCNLILEEEIISFLEEDKCGNVWNMRLLRDDLIGKSYCYDVDGVKMPDPYGTSLIGKGVWGEPAHLDELKTSIKQHEFDWEGDKPLNIPYEDAIVYRAHVRGFTKHKSSGVKAKGTFAGVMEKIPYLKELGITTLELLPIAEFMEIKLPEPASVYACGTQEVSGKLDYWGYQPAFAFVPKAAYSKNEDPVIELKMLVKKLHQAGIELVIELYFTGKESPTFALDVVRYWVREFHLDGVHLTGQAPLSILATDPYLATTKLWTVAWDEQWHKIGEPRILGEYNDGFLVDMRRVLKGDEEQMNSLLFRNKRNPRANGVLNYMANTNGFTLMDSVCYERKHNEANGENNQDGNDYNYSWNCGVEGVSRKKKVVELRKQQIRNALLLLFLSQGTPVLLAGDEFGNTQGGNNNAYCQDNEISWLNWNQKKTNRDIFEFVKYLIAFRKEHSVFHMLNEPRVMDYKACGCPDISYHGTKAWQPEFEHFRRELGVMYCGNYGVHGDGSLDDYFFVAYNMHWELHEFALPHLPKTMSWQILFQTDDTDCNGYFEDTLELEEQKQVIIPPRTIVVLIGKKRS